MGSFFGNTNCIKAPILKDVIETKVLKLDSSKAKNDLKWQPMHSFKQTLQNAAEFKIRSNSGELVRDISLDMINKCLEGINHA